MFKAAPGTSRRAEALAWSAVVLLGLMSLPQPFGWDQALFAMGARALHHGAALYRDFWDVKQPGIYLFYWLGGALFGFHEGGVHLCELLWNLGLAALAVAAVRRESRTGAAAPAAALLTAGFGYAVMGDWHLTQVESLAGFPLLACAVAANAAARSGTRAPIPAVWSGLAGGFALLFKLAFLPIVGAFWVTALVALLRDRSVRRGRGAASAAAGVVVGLAIPWLAVVVWLSARGTLAEAWWIWIVYPREVMARMTGLRISQLADGLAWFAVHWAPVLALGIVGLVRGARRGSLLAVQMGWWVLVGLGTILVQRWSYWQYQFVLLAVPAGVLAALGVGELHAALQPWLNGPDRPARRVAFGAGLALLFALPLAAVGVRVLALARHGFALTPEGRIGFQELVSHGNSQKLIGEEVAFLKEPGALPGSVYVLGNPLYNWISGRPSGAPRHGGVLIGAATREQWERTAAFLQRHPPAYVVFERGYFENGRARPEAAGFFEWLDHSYVPERENEHATWWVRRP
jgi:hypothetical protein